ncbi:MAG TPA: hypothetical protein VFE78_17560, partial [Gemmataceae bacterium]|nr:hypothetical protein [Gemmataceae bacterium]
GTGLPAYLEFEMPAGAEYFTLEVNGARIHQALSDRAAVPAQGTAASAPPVPPPAPPPPAQQQQPAAKAPAAPASPAQEDDEDAEWRGIDLVLGKPGEEPTDIDLEKHKDQ